MMDRIRTFMRVGIPCSLKATRFDYEAPPGWRIVSAYRLCCGWFSILLEKEKSSNDGGE